MMYRSCKMTPDSSTPGKDMAEANPPKEAWIEDSDGQNVMAVFRSYDEEFVKTTEAQLRRKIDTRILPLIVTIYLFNYLDRNSITQARLYSLQDDTGVHGAQYQTAISIFSAGYILMQLPAAMLMTKLRPSLYLVWCSIPSLYP
jgi:hypothetical protein